MQRRIFLPLILLTVTVLGFQNCSDFNANNLEFHSSSLADTNALESKSVDKLYYYYQKSSTKNDNKKENYEVLFDLKNKVANLVLKSADEIKPITKNFSLSDKEIKKIKDLLENVKIEKSVDLERIGDVAEEYIIPYFNDSSSLLVYLETAEALLDGYKASVGKDKVSEVLNDILTDHLDSSLIVKILDFLENKSKIENLIKKLINKIKNIEIDVSSSSSGSGNVTVDVEGWDIEKIFNFLF